MLRGMGAWQPACCALQYAAAVAYRTAVWGLASTCSNHGIFRHVFNDMYHVLAGG